MCSVCYRVQYDLHLVQCSAVTVYHPPVVWSALEIFIDVNWVEKFIKSESVTICLHGLIGTATYGEYSV
jgi:hypothetical protein